MGKRKGQQRASTPWREESSGNGVGGGECTKFVFGLRYPPHLQLCIAQSQLRGKHRDNEGKKKKNPISICHQDGTEKQLIASVPHFPVITSKLTTIMEKKTNSPHEEPLADCPIGQWARREPGTASSWPPALSVSHQFGSGAWQWRP